MLMALFEVDSGIDAPNGRGFVVHSGASNSFRLDFCGHEMGSLTICSCNFNRTLTIR